MSAAAGVEDTADAFPTKRLKHVVALRRLRASAGDAARPYVGLEDIESGTGRLANGPRGKRGSSPPAPSVTDGDFSSLSRDSARYPSSPPAPSVTDGDGEPGRCFHQNAGGSSPSAPSVTDGNEATGADFEPGDVLFGKLRPYLAKAWVADFPGRCTTEALVMEPTSIEPRFLRSVCLSSRFVSDVDASTFGSKMPRADWDFIGNMPVPVPDADTQRNIADHLDRETARLDALVAAKERLLKLLAEKRRAVVTRAVTRGLDAADPSGIAEPIQVTVTSADERDLPAGWANPPVYARYSVQLGKMLDERRISGTHLAPYLRNTDIQWDKINTADLPEMDFDQAERDRYALRRGDLLVCEGGDVGRTAEWNDELGECFFQKAIHRLRPITEQDEPGFFKYFMRMAADRGDFTLSTASTIQHLTAEKLRVVRYPAPPRDEQRAIVEHLDRETSRLDILAAEVHSSMVLLKERRAALIAAAVTGRLDVGRTPCG